MAAKKTATSEKPLTKTGFIRSFPDSTPADELVTKGKELGLELTKKLIWTTQSEMRGVSKGKSPKAAKKPAKSKKAAKAPKAASAAPAEAPAEGAAAAPAAKKKPGPKKGAKKAAKAAKAPKASKAKAPKASKAKAPAKAASGSGAENKMKALLVELGTARADEIYRSVRSQLSAIAGG